MIEKRASLGARLLIGASVLIVTAMIVTGAAMGFALFHFIRGQVDGRLDGQIEAVADALRGAPDGGLRLERIVDGPPFDRPLSGWYWEVLDAQARPLLRSRSLLEHRFTLGPVEEPLGPGPDPHPRARPGTADGRGPSDEPLRVRVRTLPSDVGSVTIAAAAPRAALAGPLREAMTPVAVALGFLAILLIGGGVVQVWVGLRPLGTLRRDVVAVREGRSERIAGPQPAEILPLVDELNALLDQHAANLERARRHVANLAHSLKTPLATLALTIDGAGADPDGRIGPLVSTMDRMIRHHLARARAAALGGQSRARVILEPRVADHRAAFARLYADKAIVITVAVPEGLAVACEAQDLDEILGNLLDNACRFAAGRVAVTARASGSRVAIAIEDDGPGLADGQGRDVLRPGLRLDESAPGYGFGLPIARELTELYGGAVALGRASMGGLAVALDLPRAGPADPAP